MSALHPQLVAAEDTANAIPIRFVGPGDQLDEAAQRWADVHAFEGKPGQFLVVPNAQGGVGQVIVGAGDRFDPMSARGLSARLPGGVYRLDVAADQAGQATLAFLLGTYVFDRYKARTDKGLVRLVTPEGLDAAEVSRIAAACALAREMVDTPAADMGPLQIETIAREIAESAGATITVTTGDALLEDNYPAVHAVGRAAAPHRAPRVIEIGWKLDQTDLPLVALVGKGVVFDTGGLDLKPAAGMRNMKKDMGGSAHALALGRLVMQADLPVRLVVIVAAVENAVSADAFRPGDILNSRKGLTIEIGNTDAEGRLILADALTRAGEHSPDLTLDFATLTGAARIALGPELPPLYTDDEALAASLLAAAAEVRDPLWRMPLWAGYRAALDTEIADMKNDSSAWAQAGSVTAALFLQKFAPVTGAWAHMDIFAWNPRARPGYPEGAEAQALRACYAMLRARYAA
ncbi:leucyl aminopeptidase family protein [Brevundimonas nasdae]|uniref:Leucyl aminopeptidase family protein n=1 Tax=Brevundimonas nasdae TaxID=172043 RepID=A0ABX8TGC8_9CAUL|nr:leucyl aminopeptidase family protein [Brevundimonas nasdae]QYC09490.1 leucyl aminopeptidase family protein [Brevundimonas nasdae]QYC15539.1 leucyl aminopeptidase family protein [Brevundimonas nasdae]